MNLKCGGSTFLNVQIPLLWGTRVLITHDKGDFSIIDLEGDVATLEVLRGKPSQGIEFAEIEDGFVIYRDGQPIYLYSPARRLVRDLSGRLPECEVAGDQIRIGTNKIKSATIAGSPVGVGISESGFFIGGPLPTGLARLQV